MNTFSSTSTGDTPNVGAELRRSNPSDPRRRFEGDSPSPSATGAIGRSCISDCTMMEEEAPDTYTSSDDCEFEFIMQAGDRHPVGIVCATHDWTADVGTGI